MRTGNIPEVWEDGKGTDPDRTNDEWWQLDIHPGHGFTLVFVDFPKPVSPIRKGLASMIDIEFDRPGGAAHAADGLQGQQVSDVFLPTPAGSSKSARP